MKPNRFVVLGVIAPLGLLGFLISKPAGAASDDDEAPIYVKNGSMIIESGKSNLPNDRWKWVAGRTTFSHEPRGPASGSSGALLYVKVVTSQATCPSPNNLFEGRNVDIAYSESGVQAKFRRVGPAGNKRTKLTPMRHFKTTATGLGLRHDDPDPSRKGFIKEVKVSGGKKGGTCTFPGPDASLEIVICAGPNRAECK